MLSPASVAANLACVLYLARHHPSDEGELRTAVDIFRAALGGAGLAIQSSPSGPLLNAFHLDEKAPGASAVNEHLLAQRISLIELPPSPTAADVTALARLLAAYPGTYADWTALVAALGEAATRIRLVEGSAATEFQHFEPVEGPSMVAAGPRERIAAVVDEGGLILPPIAVTVGEPRSEPRLQPAAPRREDPRKLEDLVRRARSSMEAHDWDTLLTVAGEFLAAAESAVSESAARFYRIELRRQLSRREIAQIARLAATGGRRADATAVLQQLGGEATETLMEQLMEAETMAERRGYYSALTRMADGTEVIIHQLGNPLWYVVRNAADLCGEMGLASAIPALADQTAHPDTRVRKSVADALHRIGSAETLEPLARMLKDPSAEVRRQVIGRLQAGHARSLAMPLASLLQHEEDPDVVREILGALGRIATPDALMALRGAARGEIRRLSRKQRVQAVESLGQAGSPAAQILTALATDSDPELSQAAGRTLQTVTA